MKTSSLLLLTSLLLGCPKVPDADPLEPAPSVRSFTASQAEVPVGTNVTLRWSVENATEVRIDELALGALPDVSGATGELEVTISGDSLFVLTARNARGASDTAVVAVRAGAAAGEVLFTALPDTIEAGQSVTLAWSAPNATSVSITATPGGPVDLGGQGASGSVTVSPTTSTSYSLTAGVRSATTSVTVRPTLLSFTASSLSVDPGSTVTLSWTTANATRVQLSAPGRGTLVDETDPAKVAAGSFAEAIPALVDPGQFFSYLLTVTGPGATLTDSLVVTINGRPAVVSFTAPALARQADGTLPLTWQTTGADQVSISADGVEIYRAPSAALAASGTLDVPVPADDVTYQLTARANRGGEVTATRTVDVVTAPTVTFTATPSAVAAGAPVTLSWTGRSIRRVFINEASGASVHFGTGRVDTGSATVRPNADTTYRIVVDNGLGDRATATAPVTVSSPIGLTVAETGALRLKQDVMLSWTVPGSTPSLVGVAHDQVATRAASGAFDDISATGTKLIFPTAGNIVVPIDTPFRTVLFGQQVGSRITVSRYGYLVFGHANGANSTDVALPNTKLEPMAVAPYWESLTVTGVYWEVKSVGGVPTLLVQWQSSTATFQAKIYASGQIDFEYADLPTTVSGKVGITGLRTAQTVVGPTPAVDQGFTFFGARTSPLALRVLAEGPLVGHLELSPGELLRVSTTLSTVVNPDQLIINEALPLSTVGVAGQWAELRNARDTEVDLTGWSFTLADGGVVPVSGTVPARGVLVVGASTDPALNDDAGVQVALPGFNLAGQAALTLGRGGTQSALALTSTDAGTAWVNDVGPYKLNTGTSAGRCVATAPYGSQATPQRGTPGRDTGCGFPYALSSRPPGYFDISASGTPLMTDLNDAIATVSLAAAPVPYFGVARTSLQVSTNGFATFETRAASATNYVSSSTPSLTDSNLLLAVFADNLTANLASFPDAQVFSRRVGPNEDPFAAAPHWIVQWHHFSYRTTGTSLDNYNFQVKLFDDGVIEYHYDAMESVTSSQYAAGTSAVTWLENETGSQVLLVNALSTTPGISPRSAFRFVPR